MESSARGDLSPLVAGSEIDGAGAFPIMDALMKPIMPASRPLITPAMIAFLTAGEALPAGCSETVTGGAYTKVGVGIGGTAEGASAAGASAGGTGITAVSTTLVSDVADKDSELGRSTELGGSTEAGVSGRFCGSSGV